MKTAHRNLKEMETKMLRMAKLICVFFIALLLPSTIYSYTTGQPSGLGVAMVFGFLGLLSALNLKR